MKFDLEDRTVRFTCDVLKLVESLPDSKVCNHLASQLLRSGTAPSLVYGEACGAESPQDFIHKMGLALKELKETRVGMLVIRERAYAPDKRELDLIINENEQLIAIFGKSINTARRNLKK
jgi:four helix bundle protein